VTGELGASADLTWLWLALGFVGAILAILLFWVWRKGRPFADGDVFRASRISSGNRLFPTQVLITPSSVVQYDVLIETSGGTDPIVCHGHRKGDAGRMKNLIEKYQTDYYRGPGGPGGPVPVDPDRIGR
jgi:hypothetical protein